MASYSSNTDRKINDVEVNIQNHEDAPDSRTSCCNLFRKSSIPSTPRSPARAIKILVLGPGGSGKSTVLKQMRIIHGERFRRSEQERFKQPIIENVFDSVYHLVDAMYNKFHLEFQKKENQGYYERLINAKEHLLNGLNDWNMNKTKYCTYIKSIWDDASIKECYARRNKFYLHDSAKYYIESIDRIVKSDYIPNIDDILRVREPTTAIIEHRYKIQDTEFLFVDVGGQRSERRKWISCFQDVTSIMFVASLSDYDLYLTKDELRSTQRDVNQNVNRLHEALNLFRTTINWEKDVFDYIKDTNGEKVQRKRKELLFKDVGIVLFLNKKDLFEEKILSSPLNTCFREFDDLKCNENNKISEAKKFISNKFTEYVSPERNFYIHHTYALDRNSMEIVIQAVKDRIIEDMLRHLML